VGFIGTPSGCPHLFHWDCLTRWSESQNTCPQCKHRFRFAGKYRAHDRELVETVKFKKRNRVPSEQDESDDLPLDLCEKCQEPGNEEELILCDGMDFTCNAMFHYRCVGFNSVPAGLWFCESCLEKNFVPAEARRSQSPKKRKPKVTRSRSRSPIVIGPPRLFPRQLLVHLEANRRSSTSSRVPLNLIIDPHLPLPARPAQTSTESVFARFRQRRLEKKRNENIQ
jgi:hypothetical protein